MDPSMFIEGLFPLLHENSVFYIKPEIKYRLLITFPSRNNQFCICEKGCSIHSTGISGLNYVFHFPTINVASL